VPELEELDEVGVVVVVFGGVGVLVEVFVGSGIGDLVVVGAGGVVLVVDVEVGAGGVLLDVLDVAADVGAWDVLGAADELCVRLGRARSRFAAVLDRAASAFAAAIAAEVFVSPDAASALLRSPS